MHRSLAHASRTLPVLLATGIALLVAGAGPARAATTVDLGTAGAFAVLAGSGITNTGQTTISGDIGTSPTPAETGVAPCPSAADCVTLTGSNHPADATALQAKKDLTTAYDAAAGQSADAVLGADLGGSTFTSGVYRTAGSLGLTGQVTLDAQGVGGAVFVFQIGSSLVTASASSVLLVNGASSCNVFFQVGSAATLGTGSTFRGTILAHDDISLGDSVTVDGRLLGGEQASGAGAVTLIHDTIARPACTSGGSSGGTSGGSTSGTSGGTSGSSTSGTGTSGSSTGGSSTTGGTSGSSTGSTGSGTSGTDGSTGGTTGTGSSTGSSGGSTGTTGTSSGSGGGTTAGTTGAAAGGTSGTAAGSSSTSPTALPFSGAATGPAALLGLLSLVGGSLALLVARRPRRSVPA
jgi:hypothetical protein